MFKKVLQKNELMNLKRGQIIMTDMLRHFNKVCRAHQIQYWCIGGTLIGVVRHKGWIPHDADIDVGMLQSDYDKFKSVIQKELPDEYWFQHSSTDTHYDSDIPKIRYKYGYYKDVKSKNWHNGLQLEIFVSQAKNGIICPCHPLNDIQDTKYEVIFPLKEAVFEDISVFIPNQIEQYCTKAWGEYPPPILPAEKQYPHEGRISFDIPEWMVNKYPNLYATDRKKKELLPVVTEINNNKEDKISVVIPTFNRFEYLINAVRSIQNQTYKNIEIIVVNDCSTQKEYYLHDWEKDGVTIIHLEHNSKNKFGFACPGGYQRNIGIHRCTGEYIAFCDDDYIWLPAKLEKQIKAMKQTGCKMSATEGLIGKGVYHVSKKCKKYNSGHHFKTLQNIYKKKGSHLLDNGFPRIWNLNFLNVHNCMICSSVVIHKDIIKKKTCNIFPIARYADDYKCWLEILKHTDSVYVYEPCVYYDSGHGDGHNY